MMVPTVAVTGAGVITAAGAGLAALLDTMLAGRCCAAPRAVLPPPGLPALKEIYAAWLASLPTGILPARGTRALGPEGRAFSAAALLASAEAGFSSLPPGAGIAVGTNWAGLDDYVQLLASGLAHGPGAVMPTQGPRTGLNAPAAQASIMLGADGPNLTVCTGNAASADAITAASDLIRSGQAPVMLAGGIDLLSYFPVYADRLADPGFASISDPRPFDRKRRGPAPGEAAVVLALEPAAAVRGRPVLGWLLGSGSACIPSRSGSLEAGWQAVTSALRMTGITPRDVDAVVAGADGSPGLDAVYGGVLLEVFGPRVPVCSPHGSVGNCAGAGAAVQAALALAVLRTGIIPPTCGFTCGGPGLRGLGVTTSPVRGPVSLVLTLSLDLGGHAAALLMEGTRA